MKCLNFIRQKLRLFFFLLFFGVKTHVVKIHSFCPDFWHVRVNFNHFFLDFQSYTIESFLFELYSFLFEF